MIKVAKFKFSLKKLPGINMPIFDIVRKVITTAIIFYRIMYVSRSFL